MEIQHIFSDDDELADAVGHEFIHHIPLQKHDVVVQAVVPFAYQLKNGEALLVVGEKDFQVHGLRAEIVPVRVDVVVVDLLSVLELIVGPAVKRGLFVTGRVVIVQPAMEWRNVLHEM